MRSKRTITSVAGLCLLILLAVSTGAFAAGPGGVNNGIALWADADTLGLANGASLDVWPDSSGLGNNLHSPGGSSTYTDPTYLTNQINGHAAVRLNVGTDGTTYLYNNTMFTISNPNGPLSGNAMTAFVVFKYRGYYGTDPATWPDYGESGIVAFGNLVWGGNAVAVNEYGGYNMFTTADTFQDFTWQTVLSRGDFIPYQQYGVMTLEFNGANSFAKLNGATAATGDATGRLWAGNFLIGGRPGNGSGRFSALDVASVVLYDRALTSAEENAVGAYLETKYAIDTTYVPVLPKGVQGYVEDPNHVRAAGATVQVLGGTESTTTDSQGNYTLDVTSPGTYTIRASKTGFTPADHTGVVVGSSGYTSVNLTLLPPPTVSGTITNSNGFHTPLSGVNVSTDAGVYTTTTNSAGFYSLAVTPGTYNVSYYKPGFAPKKVNVNANSSVTQNVNLDQGWDLATDFSDVSDPNGPWSYGYAFATAYGQAYTQNKFQFLPYKDTEWYNQVNAQPYDQVWHTAGGGFYGQTIWKLNQYIPIENYPGSYGEIAYREPMRVISGEGGYFGPSSTVIRLTMPTSGYFNISARFAGETPNGNTSAKVAIIRSGSYMVPLTQISGFAGRAANGYTDSSGTSPVLTYATSLDLNLGEKIDLVVTDDKTWPNSWPYDDGGWVQTDFTVAMNKTSLSGRITSNLPGNPPIIGATVILNGHSDPWPTYTAKTDSAGNYLLSVRPDTYDIEAGASGYNTGTDASLVVLPADTATTQNFQLACSGNWSLINDFNLTSNPNGQWSYGYYTVTSDQAPFYTFSLFANHSPSFQPELAGWASTVTQGWPGNTWTNEEWICKNTSGAPVEGNASAGLDYYVEPNHMSFGGGDFNMSTPVIRWTAPDSRIVKLTFTIASQAPSGTTHWTSYDGDSNAYVTLLKNQSAMATKSVVGFSGRAANQFTDSIGPAPMTTFATTLSVNPGDTLDLATGQPIGPMGNWTGNWQFPYRSLDVWIDLNPDLTAHQAASIAAIKALNVGDTVMLTTPMQLCCASAYPPGFDKRYGDPTPGNEFSFYVQNTDRTQGIKCITDGTVPIYAPGCKITFTGRVDTQFGQKVVRVQSINSAVVADAPKPLGKGAKSLSNSGTFVRVWGKITQLVANTGSDSAQYAYEYMVINDGGGDIKIPLHVQNTWVAIGDAIVGNLAVGHYVAVSGIAGTTTGSDVVVYPRIYSDIYDYTALGR